MRIKNKELFNKYVNLNNDLNGLAIADFAVRWAEMIESRVGKGIRFEDIAESTSYQANIDCLNRFQIAAAVGVLIEIWENGEQLGKWFERAYGAQSKIKNVDLVNTKTNSSCGVEKNDDTAFLKMVGKVFKHVEKSKEVLLVKG